MMAKPPAKKTLSPKKKGIGAKGKKTTSAAARKAAAALKSVSSPKMTATKTRKKPGPKPGTKRGATTAAGAPRQKPGPKPGSKRGPITAAGTPRKKPGPKPAAKKQTLKKPTLQKTKTVKPAAKKPATKRAAVKNKAPLKQVTSVKKTTTIKKAAKIKTVAQKKPTTARKPTTAVHIETLRARINNIQAQLKRSDARTKTNITTLEKAYATLQAKVGTESPELSEQVSLLSEKIENITASAHTDVNIALNDALGNPSADNVTAALTRAEQRLVAAETAQSASIAKVNRHIADMALAIDARFKKEARANAQALSDLGNRITSVETESAEAISGLGEKIIAISSDYGQRAQDSEAIIKEKVSEIALKTQEEFEQYRANLERQIEILTQEQYQVHSKLDTTVLGLSSRVEGLEHIAGNAAMASLSNAETASYPSAIAAGNTPLPTISDEYDAFAPEPTQNFSEQIVPPNPYAVPESEPPVDEAVAHIPTEFDPNRITPNKVIEGSFGSQQIPAPVNLQAPAPTPAPLIATSALAPDELGVQYETGGFYETPMPDQAAMPAPLLLPTPELSMPYADPAYAEEAAPYEQAMNQARPGDFGTDKKPFALPKINLSKRNMQVAGIALGVAVVGLVGAKTLMGKPDSNTMIAENSINRNLDNAQVDVDPRTLSGNNEPIILETTAPTIGDYADNKVDVAPIGSAEAVTLEAAAQAGDPIAQYQLGVSYLENDRTQDAVQLIRSASDSGQPAAQYRLAKLYETGEGVAQNENMARQLTERAARSGNRIAMHDLALYHAEGRGGIKMDLDTAAKWFEKAAERGVVDSQFNLGVMYETGKGVPKSLSDAYVWYSIASAQGDQFAKERVGVLEAQMDLARLTTAESRAQKFTPSKIDQAANGIFGNLPWDAPKTAAASKADPRVKDVQVMLKNLGFDTGGVDGSIGPKTRTAIVSFQKANGLPETGQVDETLIDRLEFASGA